MGIKKPSNCTKQVTLKMLILGGGYLFVGSVEMVIVKHSIHKGIENRRIKKPRTNYGTGLVCHSQVVLEIYNHAAS